MLAKVTSVCTISKERMPSFPTVRQVYVMKSRSTNIPGTHIKKTMVQFDEIP